MNIATGIELYVLTPADLGIAFVVGLVLVLLAVAGGMWIRGGVSVDQPPVVPVDTAESATTVDLGEVAGQWRGDPQPGTVINSSVRVPPPDETVLLNSRAVASAR